MRQPVFGNVAGRLAGSYVLPARALEGVASRIFPDRGDMLDLEHQPAIADASRAADAELRAVPSGSEHTVQFYEDEAFLRETVACYLGAGLIVDESPARPHLQSTEQTG